MLDNSEQVQKIREFKPRMGRGVKIINAIASILLAGGFIFIIFFTTFYKLPIRKSEYFTLNYTFIVIGLFYLLQSVFGIINNRIYIPRLKKRATNLPIVAIQIIGYHQKPEIFISILTNIKNFTYPKFLIRRIVFCIDGFDDQNAEMRRVFLQIFPDAAHLELKKRLGSYSQSQQNRIIQEYSQHNYLVVTQPHGGRRQIKYTAFSFSTPGTDYVLHSDSDTIIGAETLQHMCKTAAGYNKSGKLCGGVVGEIMISNVLSYFALQMQISYWYAFHCGRASQSLFSGVTTISGALGLFDSRIIKQIIPQYRKQYFCKIKCIYGQDRYITSKILERGASVLFDPQAISSTQTPITVHALITQQTRWYKGFYRETISSALRFYNYDCWAVIILAYSFFVPFIVLFNLFYIALLNINSFALFTIYIFVATFLLTFRIIFRTGKLRYFHALWHPLFFFFFLLPSKLWAFISVLICFPDNRGIKKIWMKVIHMYVWVVVAGSIILGMGFIYNFVVDKQRIYDYYMLMILIEVGILIILLVHWMIWGWIFLIPKTQARLKQLLNIKNSQSWGSSKFIQTLNSEMA